MGKIGVVLPNKLDLRLRRFLTAKTGMYEHGSMTDFVVKAIEEKLDHETAKKQDEEG